MTEEDQEAFDGGFQPISRSRGADDAADTQADLDREMAGIAEDDVTLHTENGMLGMGPEAHGEEVDADLINAGKIPVVETPGCSCFHHADSFAMMRGGHLDCCVLGAFQVDRAGSLANWHTGRPDAIPAVGGAMDLATGANQAVI